MSQSAQQTGGQAVVEALIKCGITSGFGIPSIHNIGIYDALRQGPTEALSSDAFRELNAAIKQSKA